MMQVDILVMRFEFISNTVNCRYLKVEVYSKLLLSESKFIFSSQNIYFELHVSEVWYNMSWNVNEIGNLSKL